MKIAVFGNYGVQNLGDDLILMGLQEKFKNDELMVFCGNPERVRAQFGLESFPFFPGGVRTWLKFIISGTSRKEIRNAFEMLRKSDRIFIGGGGILVDRHLKAVVLWWCQLRMILKSGRPFEFIGNSLELRLKWTRTLFRPFFQKAQGISVRDKNSQVFLQSLGLRAELVEDLSAYAPLTLPPLGRQKIIAVSLCRWGLGELQRRGIRNFLERKKKEGYRIIGLAFQTMGDDDRVILREIIPGMEIKEGLKEVLEVLGTCGFLLAMRYHAVLLGLRFKIPLVGLSYQEKVRNLLLDRNLSHLCIPIQKIDEQMLQDLFGKAVEAEEK